MVRDSAPCNTTRGGGQQHDGEWGVVVREIVTLSFYFLVLTHDVGESPDLEELNAFFAKEHIRYPVFHSYNDGSSTFVWIIAGRELSKKELDMAYAAYQEHEE